VSGDAQVRPGRGNPAINSVQEAAYRALINLSSDYLQSQGRQLRFVPGMPVNAEIHLGTRSVLE
jgi:multidrug efflux pump subunit AcrA (membrane-fusion protein)